MGYTYHGTSELIALPNRTVQTYPSGLVRVERSYVCRKDEVAKFRNTIRVNELMPFDNGTPAFDGLYIFPEPQEIVRDDGFVEFRVTAYGRISEKSSFITQSLVKGTIDYTDSPGIGEVYQSSGPSINDLYIIRGVALYGSKGSDYSLPPRIEDIFVAPQGGTRLIASDTTTVDSNKYRTYTATKRVVLFLRLDSFTTVNFGFFNEYVISWIAAAQIDTSSRTTDGIPD